MSFTYDEICDMVNAKMFEMGDELTVISQKMGHRLINPCNLYYYLDILKCMGEPNFVKDIKHKLIEGD